MTDLPDKIKFGTRYIDVSHDPKLFYETRNIGDSSVDSLTVVSDATVNMELRKRIIFLNAVWVAAGTLSIFKEQRDQLESLILALFCVVRDNPFLVDIEAFGSIRSLRVLGMVLDVERVDDSDNNGEWDIKTQVIRLGNRTPNERLIQTVFHEILHVISAALSLLDTDETHLDISRFAWVLALLFVENDFSWVLEQ